jgi:hypothetical protein
MALSNAQIERYSRQIIVPKVGGLGQERLRASRILMIGECADLEPSLAYLVGAGVGRIYVSVPAGLSAFDALIGRMRELNSDVAVSVAPSDTPADLDLTLILAATDATVDAARTLSRRGSTGALIVARLDSPAKIAVILARPPCPGCAGADLLAPVGDRAENAGFVTMVATVEAFKILVRYSPGAEAWVAEFDGYETKMRPARPLPGYRECACPAPPPQCRDEY